jgi:hypothetical protein
MEVLVGDLEVVPPGKRIGVVLRCRRGSQPGPGEAHVVETEARGRTPMGLNPFRRRDRRVPVTATGQGSRDSRAVERRQEAVARTPCERTNQSVAVVPLADS